MAITLNRGIKSGIFYNVCQQPEKPMKCKFDCTVVAVPIMYYKTPALCHLFTTVRVPMLFAIMPFPVLRSMMSKIISKSEQGECVLQEPQNRVCVCLQSQSPLESRRPRQLLTALASKALEVSVQSSKK